MKSQYEEKFKRKNINYNEFLAIKIGRLGVDCNYKKKGIGTYLLNWILKCSIHMSKKISFRFITVNAYISAHDFYIKNFYENTLSNEKLKKI